MQKRICYSKYKTDYLTTINSGFTIAELLIVIAIIAIISILGMAFYGAEINNTISGTLQSSLSNAAKQLKVDQIRSTTGNFPATLSAANNGAGISFNSGITTQYKVDNTDAPQVFCLSASKNNQRFYVTQEGNPLPGPCPILYLDAGITNSYQGSGTSWKDLSGYANDAVTANSSGVPTQYTYSSANDGALTFNANSYAPVNSTAALNFTTNGSFSISVWIKPDTLVSGWIRSIIVQETYLASGYRFGILNGGRPIFWTTQSGGTLSMNPASQTVTVNQWVNIIVTYNNQQAYMYINGAQAASATGTYIAGSNNVNIGLIVQEYYSGLMSGVSMYDKTLTSDEAKSIFEATRKRFGI